MVKSAFYCKQKHNPRHEFILLQVADTDEHWSNFLLLDRIDPQDNPSQLAVTPLDSRSSNPGVADDRLIVSYYGDKESLLEGCGLTSHKVVEELDFTKSASFLLYEILFMASSTSSKCRTIAGSHGEGHRFSHAMWACMLSLAPKAILKNLNLDWRKEIFHQFNLCELADILFDTRHHVAMFNSALAFKHRKVQ